MAASVALATAALVCGLLFRPKVDEYLPQYLPESLQQHVSPSEASLLPVDIPIRIEYRATRCYPTTIPAAPVVKEPTIENSIPWPIVILFVSIFALALSSWCYKLSSTAKTHTTKPNACQETEEARLSNADQIHILTTQDQETRSKSKKTVQRKNAKIADCLEVISSQADEIRRLKRQSIGSNFLSSLMSNKAFTELEAANDAAEKAQIDNGKKIQNLEDELAKKARLFAFAIFILLLQLYCARTREDKIRTECAGSLKQASVTITKLEGKVAKAKKENEELKGRVTEAEKQNEELEGKVAEADKKNDELECQLQNADKSIEHLKGLSAKSEDTNNNNNLIKIEELEGLQELAEATHNEDILMISGLQDQLEAAKQDYKEACGERETLRSSLLSELMKNESLQKYKDSAATTIRGLTAKNKSADAEVNRLSTSVSDQEAAIATAQSDNADLKRELGLLQATSKLDKEQLAAASEQIPVLEAACHKLEQDVATEKSAYKLIEQEDAKLRAEMHLVKCNAGVLETKVQELEETYNGFLEDIHAEKRKLDAAKLEIEDLQFINADLAGYNTRLKDSIAGEIEEHYQMVKEHGLDPLEAEVSLLGRENARSKAKLKNCRCGSNDPSSGTDDSDDHDRDDDPDDDHKGDADNGEETDDTDPPDSKHQPNGSASQNGSQCGFATGRSRGDSQYKKADGIGKDNSTGDTERRPLLGDPESSLSPQYQDLMTDETDGDLDVGGPPDSGSDYDTNPSADSTARVNLSGSVFLRPFGWERMPKNKMREYTRRWKHKYRQGRTAQEAHDDLAFMIPPPQQFYQSHA